MNGKGQNGLIFLTYIAFTLLMPIIGGMFLGILLIKKLNWPRWIPLVFMSLGLIGGMKDVFLLVKKEFRDRR